MPSPEPWAAIVVGLVSVLLFGLAVSAYVNFRYANSWMVEHDKWLKNNEKDWPSGGIWDTKPPEPDPLSGRAALLEKLGDTSLTEGDLGRFLLRREEVSGQSALGSVANLLISIALASTILGLIMTLFGLVESASASNPNERSMVTAIAHFPWFFIPTFIGVILGAFANKCQASIDEKFVRLWDRLDNFTITHLLPKYVQRKSTLEETTQTLAEAAHEFKASGATLAGTIKKLEGAADKLSQLDPTQWAEGLANTSQKFEAATTAYESHVATLGKSVSDFGGMLETQTLVTTKNAAAVGEVAGLLKEASGYKDELAKTLHGFKASVDKVQGLRDEIENFGTDVKGLTDSLGNWASTQDDASSKLVREVAQIKDNVEPVLEEWRNASKFFSANHDILKAGLESLVNQFEGFHGDLRQSQEHQLKALHGLYDDFEKKTGEYWRSATAELSERFDSTPDVLNELRKVAVALEGARTLGTGLPELAKHLSSSGDRLGETLDKLAERSDEVQSALISMMDESNQRMATSIDHLTALHKAHQEALDEVGRQLSQIATQIGSSQHLKQPAMPSTLSSRTFMGLPLGPPAWITNIIRSMTKEAKP